MTKRIKIPGSIEAAENRLGALDGIATATGWERAAIVYAYTYEGKPGRPAGNAPVPERFTLRAFALLKITGLRRQETVAHYRNCWKDAMQSGEAEDIKPGDTVTLPTSPFPPANRGTDGYDSEEGAQKTIERIVEKHGPGVVAKTVASKPQVAAAVVNDPKAKKAVVQEGSKRTQRIIKERKERIAAAGPDVAAQMADAVAASHANMNTTAAYNDWNMGRQRMVSAWLKGVKEQEFSPLDRHFLGADYPALRRMVDEMQAFVEAEDDPYTAVKEHRKEYRDQWNKEFDEAEFGTDIDAGLEEAERFANEAS